MKEKHISDFEYNNFDPDNIFKNDAKKRYELWKNLERQYRKKYSLTKEQKKLLKELY